MNTCKNINIFKKGRKKKKGEHCSRDSINNAQTNALYTLYIFLFFTIMLAKSFITASKSI